MARMVRKFFKQFKYGQKGFTLIELLVVVAILGVLAAVAVPNVAKFISKGTDEAAATELANVQTAVVAAMAHAKLGSIGDEDFVSATIDKTHDLNVITGDTTVSAGNMVGDYLQGGVGKLSRPYTVSKDGTVIFKEEAVGEDEGE